MVTIEFATASDIQAVVRCHQSAFRRSMTTKMGRKYLSRLFAWYISSDRTFLLVARENREVVGYSGGMIVDGTLLHGSASSMIQFTFSSAVFALLSRPWLLFHREFFLRYGLFIKNVGFKLYEKFFNRMVRTSPRPRTPYVGLVVIGVHPLFHGKGYGTLLLREFEGFARKRGLNMMILSVHSDNCAAIKSYKSNGWVAEEQNGRQLKMQKMLK